jgi:hypothetical protein
MLSMELGQINPAGRIETLELAGMVLMLRESRGRDDTQAPGDERTTVEDHERPVFQFGGAHAECAVTSLQAEIGCRPSRCGDDSRSAQQQSGMKPAWRGRLTADAHGSQHGRSHVRPLEAKDVLGGTAVFAEATAALS